VLQVEWLKLKRYRPFWLLLLFYPISLVTTLLISMQVWQTSTKAGVPTNLLIQGSPWAFPGVWHSVCYMASFFHFFPCMLVILITANEFEFKTHRQNLLDGWTRAQFFGAKLVVTGLVLLICWSCVALVAVGCGLSQKSYQIWEGLPQFGFFALQSTLYAALALGLAFWMRRGLLAMALFTAYSTVLEGMLGFFVRNQTVKHYLPLASAHQLLPFPGEVAKKFATQVPPAPALMAAAAFYIVLFLGVSWRHFQKQDL
jgi:ABC-2 type transport system permease protein